jgi:hypothetical protein
VLEVEEAAAGRPLIIVKFQCKFKRHGLIPSLCIEGWLIPFFLRSQIDYPPYPDMQMTRYGQRCATAVPTPVVSLAPETAMSSVDRLACSGPPVPTRVPVRVRRERLLSDNSVQVGTYSN